MHSRPIFVIILYLDYLTPRNFLSREQARSSFPLQPSHFFPYFSFFFFFLTRVPPSLFPSLALSLSLPSKMCRAPRGQLSIAALILCSAEKCTVTRESRRCIRECVLFVAAKQRAAVASTRVSLSLLRGFSRRRERVYYMSPCKYIVRLITVQHPVTFR